MTRKNSPFFGTITCPGCNDTVPRRSSTHRFCEPNCRQKYYRLNREIFTKNCEVCDEEYSTQLKTVTCSKFCAAVKSAVTTQLYTDDELVHLMLLNKGYGYQRFCDEITSHRQRSLSRIDYLVETTLEDTGLNLYNLLSDPSGLVTMALDEWVAAGKPTPATKNTGGLGNRLRRSQYMAKYQSAKANDFIFDPHNRRTTRKIKVYPKFNWWPYAKRQR